MDEIDTNFEAAHNRHEVLNKYRTTIQQLRLLAANSYNVSPLYFDDFVNHEYFEQKNEAFLKFDLLNHIANRRRQIIYWIIYLTLVLSCVYIYRYEKTATGMRLWRRATLPIIQRFPRLTELHDEPCLMENPFFQVGDLNCEPCAGVESVLDITETNSAESLINVVNNSGKRNDLVPFIFKLDQAPIELNDFYNVYLSNSEIFQRDAFRVKSSNSDITNLEQLFGQFNNTNTEISQKHKTLPAHNLWRCNRMLPARLVRPLFVRPSLLPNTGIALERFVAIDVSNAPTYTLPDTECPNVYIQQSLGTRFIILRPTSECRHRCRTLSIRLPQSHVLSYNLLYWKPISAPDPVSETISISFIGSYC